MAELSDKSEATTPGAASIHERLRAMAQRPRQTAVRELIEQYMAQYGGRDMTRGHRLAAWQSMIGEFTLEQCNFDLMRACRAELQSQPPVIFMGKDHRGRKLFNVKARRPKDAATVNRYMASLSAVFTWAQEQRIVPDGWSNPCRGMRRLPESPGRVRFLDAAERARLFEAVKASRYPRMYALVLMAMKTGARRGELLALTWRDIDLDVGVAMLGRTKNGDRRTLVLLPDVIEALAPFKSAELDRYVFGSVRSKHQAPASISSAWREAVERAKVKDFSFHGLRHTCASYMAQAGIPLNVIGEVLGHRSLEMTRRYSHLTTQTKAGAMLAALGEIK